MLKKLEVGRRLAVTGGRERLVCVDGVWGMQKSLIKKLEVGGCWGG